MTIAIFLRAVAMVLLYALIGVASIDKSAKIGVVSLCGFV